MKYILFLLISITAYSQEKISKVDSLVNAHVLEFREFINNEDAYVLINFDYKVSMKDLKLITNDLVIVGAGIDAKKLKKNKEYFLINFIFFYEDNILKLSGVNFRVTKINNKEIRLTNLGDGKNYDLN